MRNTTRARFRHFLLAIGRWPSWVALVFGANTFYSTPAGASIAYGPYLENKYGATGGCLLCHRDNDGGAGTVVKELGKTLKSKGLVGGGNTASLDSAIAALGDADSDGDGDSDVDELTGMGDPNDFDVLAGGARAAEPVEYGCVGGTIVGRTPPDPDATVAGLGFVAGVLSWSALRRRR